MKTLNSIKLIVLLIGSMTPPAQALCQTVTWTSSHPDIVSVDENTGVIEMISEPSATTDVTITATTQQNGKILTSTKTVQVDSCTACFNYQAPSDTQTRTYCGVKLSNGQCWMDRNLGDSAVPASSSSGNRLRFSAAQSPSACPTGWRLPTDGEWISMSAVFGVTLTASSLRTYTSAATMYNTSLKLASIGNDEYNIRDLGSYRVTTGGIISDVNWYTTSNTRAFGHYTNEIPTNISIRCIKG